MLSVAGKPILQHVIEAVAQNGILDIILIVGYRREQIFDHFGKGDRQGVNLVYITQERQLGTAHALAKAKHAVSGDFLVLAGDNLIDADTISGFVATEAPAVLLKQVPDTARYGVVMTENGLVKEIAEKPSDARGDRINTGTYAFRKEVFDFIGEDLDIPQVVNRMLTEGATVHAAETRGTWLDVVYPWDIVRLNGNILARTPANLGGTVEAGVALKGPVSIGKDTIVRSNSYIMGPVVIGENCEIGPNVCILPATSIGHNVSIAPFTTVESSVIGDDVSIGPTSIIQDSVIDAGCVVGGHFTVCRGDADVKVEDQHYSVNVGAMMGIGCSISCNVVAQPGTILGNYCEVRSMKVVGGRVPDKARVY
jgi:glucose-1-phosphate thymidylyltransferase